MLRINSKLARALAALGLAAAVALVAGCGGGGGSSSTSTTGTGGTTGGGGTASNNTVVSSTPATLAANQAAVVVSSGLTGKAPNMPMVSVTICVHGTANCQKIDNIQLDTGSFGLRLVSTAVDGTLLNALPTETVSGQTVAECFGFADGNSWGTVRTADITIGGETTTQSVPLQILGDLPQSAAGGTSNACASGTLNDTTSVISANGILGIGTAKYDCGSGSGGCTAAPNGTYFGCTTSGGTTSCGDLGVPVGQQVANPIQSFATNKNGVILNMPAVTASGASTASGFVTFGIGTASNNTLPTSGIQTFQADHFGTMQSASLSGTSVSTAFFDTGSNGLFFTDNSITQCLIDFGFYCPSSTLTRQPSVTGYNGTTATIPVSIGNAQSLFGTGFAFNNVGGRVSTTSGAFDFGLPFFYGRTVYIGYDSSSINSFGSASPAFVAF